ncbi:RHS repeat domain-containing protein, partial [Novipirellula sp.]|uniref:RHS repeat domain-containing protein n=1 Tax=Novipirellula sp. TaxID=2795430 RepID=UPI00356245F3
ATREYYFTDSWQCLEEHVDTSNTPRRQYVWGMRYIDDLVARDRDISPSGGILGERLYYLSDANWNTTAVVSDSGSVQERYEYDPYGKLSCFEPDFTPRSSSNYSVHYTYTSREWTPDVGLYYFRNRWYDPQLGRFSSRDPIFGFGDLRSGPSLTSDRGSIRLTQFLSENSASLYNYVGNRVLVAVDPSGLECEIGIHCWTVSRFGIPLGTHCGLSLCDDEGCITLDGSGGDQNNIEVDTGTHPDAGPMNSFPDSKCDCLRNYVSTFNAPDIPRSHLQGNSNWTLSCMLGKCGLAPSWGSGPPTAYGEPPCKRTEPRTGYSGSGNCPYHYNVCVEYWECP